MKKIVAFAGSNSEESINYQLVKYTISMVQSPFVELLNLNDFEIPIFSVDIEKNGIPEKVLEFNGKLDSADGIILSLAEHNGSYTAAFKNLFDWLSRIDIKVWKNKPMLLMSASTGKLGGRNVMEAALTRFPRHGLNLAAQFSLPLFDLNFRNGAIADDQLNSEINAQVEKLLFSING